MAKLMIIDVRIICLLITNIRFVFASVHVESNTKDQFNVMEEVDAPSAISCVLKCKLKEHDASFIRNTCFCLRKTTDQSTPITKKVNIDKYYRHEKFDDPCLQTPCNYGTCRSLSKSPARYRCICHGQFKLQQRNVCYGGKSDDFGTFRIMQTGLLTALKLVHRTGSVLCHSVRKAVNFGCWVDKTKLRVIITEFKSRTVVLPKLRTYFPSYKLKGYDAASRFIIFSNIRLLVQKYKQFRMWDTEDFEKKSELDNIGKHCVDVYAKFCE